jgi:hypothetical protein
MGMPSKFLAAAKGSSGEFAPVNDSLNNNPNRQRIDVYAPNGVAFGLYGGHDARSDADSRIPVPTPSPTLRKIAVCALYPECRVRRLKRPESGVHSMSDRESSLSAVVRLVRRMMPRRPLQSRFARDVVIIRDTQGR